MANRFQPNTVLWAFHTIQPSSYELSGYRIVVVFYVHTKCVITKDAPYKCTAIILTAKAREYVFTGVDLSVRCEYIVSGLCVFCLFVCLFVSTVKDLSAEDICTICTVCYLHRFYNV